MNLEIFNNLINNVKKNDFVQGFVKELRSFLENKTNSNEINQSNKYKKYWQYQKFMEDNVAANIGISRWSANSKYSDELNNEINNSILELAAEEGVLYRKKFTPNGPKDNSTYNIDKFENGEIEHLVFEANKVPKGFDNEDIIFNYKEDGTVEVREDLKQEAVRIASKKAEYLKAKENEIISDYKIEGHIYKAVENDGYIFLKDLSIEREYVIEDIDFVINCYEGEGKYQVVNGQYKKIEE